MVTHVENLGLCYYAVTKQLNGIWEVDGLNTEPKKYVASGYLNINTEHAYLNMCANLQKSSNTVTRRHNKIKQ
jgi:hypothetical protein